MLSRRLTTSEEGVGQYGSLESGMTTMVACLPGLML